jgi:hypothetical protein
MKFVILSTLVTISIADVRMSKQKNGEAPGFFAFRTPDTFNIAGIEKQAKKNNDQFIRSNIDNEANKRNPATELAPDMLPCRQDKPMDAPVTFALGSTNTFPLRWNNPHDSDCELNVWVNGLTEVVTIMNPRPCGGGYQNQQFSFDIPADFPVPCNKVGDCVMQMYAHSVEPRTYAICSDIVLTGKPAALNKRGTKTQLKPAVHFADAVDTSHLDKSHSLYRGQNPDTIRDELAAAVLLKAFVPNAGLVPLGNIDKAKNKAMDKQIQTAIKANEKKAIAETKALQKQNNALAASNGTPRACVEGELYGVVNNPTCARQFKNTYVTGVGYRDILNAFMPKFVAGNFVPFTPTLKAGPGAVIDQFGEFKVNGKPSLAPKGKTAAAAPKEPEQFVKGPVPNSLVNLGRNGFKAPIPSFVKNPAKAAPQLNEPTAAQEAPNPDDAIAEVGQAEAEGVPASAEATSQYAQDTASSNQPSISAGWTPVNAPTAPEIQAAAAKAASGFTKKCMKPIAGVPASLKD